MATTIFLALSILLMHSCRKEPEVQAEDKTSDPQAAVRLKLNKDSKTPPVKKKDLVVPPIKEDKDPIVPPKEEDSDVPKETADGTDQQTPATTKSLIEALATGTPGAWRESVIRLSHRMPGAGKELEPRVGESDELDRRIKVLLAVALVHTLPVDELQKLPRLAALAKPEIERAAAVLSKLDMMSSATYYVPPQDPKDDKIQWTAKRPGPAAKPHGGFIVPFYLEKLKSDDIQIRAAALIRLKGMPGASTAVAHFLNDNTQIHVIHDRDHHATTMAQYAKEVSENNRDGRLALEVEVQIRSLLELNDPYDGFSSLVNLVRGQGTFREESWESWWNAARPNWNLYWKMRLEQLPTRDALNEIANKQSGFVLTRTPSEAPSIRLEGPPGRSGRLFSEAGELIAEGPLPLEFQGTVSHFAPEVDFDKCVVWRKEMVSNKGKSFVLTVSEPTEAQRKAAMVSLSEPKAGWWKAKKPCPKGTNLIRPPVKKSSPNSSIACYRSDGTLHGTETKWQRNKIMSITPYQDGEVHGIQTHWSHMKSASWHGRRLDYYRRPGCKVK